MQEWLDNPAVQAGLAPLIVALIVASLLARTRFAWVAIVAGYATMVAMSSGFSVSPLTASRKIVLLVLLAPLVGLAVDLTGLKFRIQVLILSLASGVAAVWSMWSVLAQRDLSEVLTRGGLVFACTAGVVALGVRLRSNGLATGAAGVGLGLAAGIAALLSASIGYFMAGIAIAAASGAMLLVQIFQGRVIASGFIGTLTIGLAAALFASATLMLAQLPWYALPLLMLVPAALAFDSSAGRPIWVRCALLMGISSAAGAVTVLAAWVATRA